MAFPHSAQQLRTESRFWPLAGLVVLVVALYLPVISYEFLNWDDSWYVLNNELITSWSPANLYRVATEIVARNYAPVTVFTLLVEHTLFGEWAGGYHFVNILLHAGNAVLIYLLLRQLTGNAWLCWIVAALFAVHPAQVESVAWVSSCKTLLSSGFMLASLICWLRPVRSHKQELWGMAWLALALLSRASAVTMPVIVIAYDVLVVDKKLRASIERQFVPLLMCALLLLSTMTAQVAYWGGLRDHLSLNRFQILAVDSTVLMRYAGILLWPRDLCVLYDVPFRNIEAQILLSTVGWGIIAWGLWKLRHRSPLFPLAGITWVAMFLPVINLFPLTTLMNDRYLYLTCVPFFAVLIAGVQAGAAWLAARHAAWKPALNWSGVLASVVVLAMYSLTTIDYLPVWRDPVTLWHHARTESGTLAVVHIQWALTMEAEGRPTAAAAALRHALEHCHPDTADQERIVQMLSRLEG